MKNLRKTYENSVKEYLSQFIIKHDFPELEFWVGDEIGGIAQIGDYYFNFQDIKLDIDDNIPEPTILDWYEYSVENEIKVSFKKWLDGRRTIKCWISLSYFYYELYTEHAFKYCHENNFEIHCVEDFEFTIGADHVYEIRTCLDALTTCQKLILPNNYSEYDYSRIEHDYFLLNDKRTENDIIYI